MDYEEKIKKNIEKFEKIFEMAVVSERKKNIAKMMENIGELYFIAPASSKEEYHLSYPGGLAEHSFNVYKNLRNFFQMKLFDSNEESMFIVSMFHDLGKACCTDLKSPHYKPTTEEWKLRKGWLYEYGNDSVYMTNHLRSLFILQHFNITLTPEEYSSIYLNDGMYLESNRSYGLKECPLALFLHMSDRIALKTESEKSQ